MYQRKSEVTKHLKYIFVMWWSVSGGILQDYYCYYSLSGSTAYRMCLTSTQVLIDNFDVQLVVTSQPDYSPEDIFKKERQQTKVISTKVSVDQYRKLLTECLYQKG